MSEGKLFKEIRTTRRGTQQGKEAVEGSSIVSAKCTGHKMTSCVPEEAAGASIFQAKDKAKVKKRISDIFASL